MTSRLRDWSEWRRWLVLNAIDVRAATPATLAAMIRDLAANGARYPKLARLSSNVLYGMRDNIRVDQTEGRPKRVLDPTAWGSLPRQRPEPVRLALRDVRERPWTTSAA